MEEHGRIKIMYPPTATPNLSSVESVWKYVEYRLVTSEHQETLEGLMHAVSEYFKTRPTKLDTYKFLYRYV